MVMFKERKNFNEKKSVVGQDRNIDIEFEALSRYPTNDRCSHRLHHVHFYTAGESLYWV